MTTEQTQKQLRALAAELDRLVRRVEEIGSESGTAWQSAQAAQQAVKHLADDLVAATRSAASVAGGGDEEAPALGVTWLTVPNVGEAKDLIVGLQDWLASVYGRWQTKPLPDCWAWHPAVAAELLALRDAWYAATHGEKASATAVMDWLDRHRPGTARRVDQETKDCSLAKHTSDKLDAFRPPRVEGAEMLDELTRWWGETSGRTAAPSPSAEMLAAARARRSAMEDRA